MRILSSRAFALFALFISLSACRNLQGLQDQYSVDVVIGENTRDARITQPGEMMTFDVHRHCLPGQGLDDKGGCGTPIIRYFSTGSSLTADDRALLRNRFQDYLMWRSEQQCQRHTAGILATQSAVNFSLGSIATGLAGFAAIVTAPAASILAASSAGIGATKSQFNEEFYQHQVAPAVVRKIISSRSDYYSWLMTRRGTPVERMPEFIDKISETTKIVQSGTDPAAAKAPDPGAKSGTTTTPVTQIKVDTPNKGTTSTVSINDYSIWAAIGDVEQYQKLCNFSVALSSLINPGPAYADTQAGIAARLAFLRTQLGLNRTEMTSATTYQQKQTLEMMNANITTQMLVLQHRMLTAPLTLDAKTPAGG